MAATSPTRETGTIPVIAVITAKLGQRESILTHFRANVPAVRAEKGCIEYDAAAPHMAAYGAKTREFIASRVIHILQPA